MFNGPTVDGSNNPNGHYIVLYSPYSSFITTSTLIRSSNYERMFKHSYNTCVMKFDYYLFSNNTEPLTKLYVKAGNTHDSTVYIAQFTKTSPQWQRAEVHIGSYVSSFLIEIKGSRAHVNETIAVDNIEFVNCSLPDPLPPDQGCPKNEWIMCESTRVCIHLQDLCDFEDNCGDNSDEQYSLCASYVDPKVVPKCAFEKSFSDCGFSSEVLYDFSWSIIQSSKYSFLEVCGPGSDHTTCVQQCLFCFCKMLKP